MAAPLHASKEYVRHFFTSESVDSRPSSWEVALHTGNPGTGDDYEVNEYSYSRQEATFSSYLHDSGKFYEAGNDSDIEFPEAEHGEDFTVTHYTVRNRSTGEALATGTLAVPIRMQEGSKITFPAGYIKVRGV